MKTIVISDVHLGTEKSNEAAFSEFLGSLHDDKKLTDGRTLWNSTSGIGAWTVSIGLSDIIEVSR